MSSTKTLVECGASTESVDALMSSVGGSYGTLCRVFWEVRRVGKAKRGEVFAALRSEGLKFSGKVSAALWSLADKLQTSSEWTCGMDELSETAAIEAAKADAVKHSKSDVSEYDKAMKAHAFLSDFLKEDK